MASTATKRPTVAEAMAAVDTLHRQVVRNQETLDSRMSEFDKEFRATLEQWGKRNARDRESLSAEFDDLKTSVTKKQMELTGRIEEVGDIVASVKQATETLRETTLDIKQTVDSLQASLTKPVEPAPMPPPTVPTIEWDTFSKNPWYPWLKFAACCVLGVLVYHFVVVPALTRTITPGPFPNLIRPTVDPHTPYGAATLEVSREPFRSDTASRVAFGRIFVRLDELVRSGGLTEFEGYYNEFGREMQRAIPGNKYGPWADLWSRLAVVCHRYGNGANDLGAFNANLQAAARVVSGNVAELPGRYELSGSPFATNDSHSGAVGTVPVAAGTTSSGAGQPVPAVQSFLPSRP